MMLMISFSKCIIFCCARFCDLNINLDSYQDSERALRRENLTIYIYIYIILILIGKSGITETSYIGRRNKDHLRFT